MRLLRIAPCVPLALTALSGCESTDDAEYCRIRGLVLCGNVCVDTSVDPSNCGACGVNCGGQYCANGICQSGCLFTDKDARCTRLRAVSNGYLAPRDLL